MLKSDLVSREEKGTSFRAPLGHSGSSSNSGSHRATTTGNVGDDSTNSASTAGNVGSVSSSGNSALTKGNIDTGGSGIGNIGGSKAVSGVDSSFMKGIPNTGVSKSDASTSEIRKLDGPTSNVGDSTSLTNKNVGIGASEIRELGSASETRKVGGAPKIRKLVGTSEKGRHGVFMVRAITTDSITTKLKDSECRSRSCIRSCKGKQCAAGKYTGTIQLPSGGAVVFV